MRSFCKSITRSWIRVGVRNFVKELKSSKPYEVEKIIRPGKAYPSGGYGVSIKKLANFVNLAMTREAMTFGDFYVEYDNI